ncbi:MAG: type I 3-dehydroquinate dehydratase [Clostridiales bacterium]|nr:type I 3-dehydroquinate dehydratase [Clostridiales bacterium]
MNPVVVKNCRIGEGKAKIIVPIVGVTQEAILAEAATFDSIPVDVVEWRIDWYEDVFDTAKVIETAGKLQQVLGDIPVLCTFRTAKEGGEKAIEPEVYAQLLKDVAASGTVDLIDVEIFTGDAIVSDIIAAAHAAGVKVVASNHDFFKTPSQSDIVYRLRKMQDMGADIPKIAVMPTCKKDVITLLAATEEMATNFADRPIITMSMSGTGVISRLVGESLGSSMTFGAAAKASAPGQIGVKELDTVLETIHNSL